MSHLVPLESQVEKGKASGAKRKRERAHSSIWLKYHLGYHTARTYARTKRNNFPVGLTPPTSDFKLDSSGFGVEMGPSEPYKLGRHWRLGRENIRLALFFSSFALPELLSLSCHAPLCIRNRLGPRDKGLSKSLAYKNNIPLPNVPVYCLCTAFGLDRVV